MNIGFKIFVFCLIWVILIGIVWVIHKSKLDKTDATASKHLIDSDDFTMNVLVVSAIYLSAFITFYPTIKLIEY